MVWEQVGHDRNDDVLGISIPVWMVWEGFVVNEIRQKIKISIPVWMVWERLMFDLYYYYYLNFNSSLDGLGDL